MKLLYTILCTPLLIVVSLMVAPSFTFAQRSVPENARVDTSNVGVVVRVAPGDPLPIAVRLSNFGGGTRIDVLVQYGIFTSTGQEVYATSETVAVETTATFIKTIPIPFDVPPGTYVAKTSIEYGGQLVPATTQFPFTVERKIFGLFQSTFFLYGAYTLTGSMLLIAFGYALVRHRRNVRFMPFEYADIPHHTRIFYEILSDTITQMRQRVGDDALEIASTIEGLTIDPKNGRVLALSDHPSKIIATLVSKYEKLLGKKVSFSLRRDEASM